MTRLPVDFAVDLEPAWPADLLTQWLSSFVFPDQRNERFIGVHSGLPNSCHVVSLRSGNFYKHKLESAPRGCNGLLSCTDHLDTPHTRSSDCVEFAERYGVTVLVEDVHATPIYAVLVICPGVHERLDADGE